VTKRRGVLVPMLVSLLLTAGELAHSAHAADCEGAWAFGRVPFSGKQWGWSILYNYCAPSCGTYSTVLYAEQRIIVAGLVLSVFHDPAVSDPALGNYLHVQITPTDGYVLDDVRLSVSTSPLPKNPAPGKFPYQLNPNVFDEIDALIPLTMAPNTQLYIAVHRRGVPRSSLSPRPGLRQSARY
jgi:hypothetical protein